MASIARIRIARQTPATLSRLRRPRTGSRNDEALRIRLAESIAEAAPVMCIRIRNVCLCENIQASRGTLGTLDAMRRIPLGRDPLSMIPKTPASKGLDRLCLAYGTQ